MTHRATVLIAGSGPAGLLLGHALKNAGIAFRIFERDASIGARAQGYRFRITGDGVRALQNILSAEHFTLLRASCAIVGQANHFAFIDALTGLSGPSAPPPPMDTSVEPLCADRTTFRSVLAQGLEPYIEFGKEISSSSIEADGVVAHFADGTEAQGTVLVAADGSWSKTRQQHRPELVPVDTEARWLYGKTPLTEAVRAAIDPRFLESMQLVKDTTREPHVALLVEPTQFSRDLGDAVPVPADYVYWVLGARSDRFDAGALPQVPTSQKCAALSKELTKAWQPAFQTLFEHQDEASTSLLRIPSMKPPLPAWEPTRVALVGDAAHCMSPTGGQGATTSLMDIACLAKLFAEEGVSVNSIGKYEKSMREYADKAITVSRMGGVKFIGMRSFEELKPFESH